MAMTRKELWIAIGTPLPADECEPISREEQAKNFADFLKGHEAAWFGFSRNGDSEYNQQKRHKLEVYKEAGI